MIKSVFKKLSVDTGSISILCLDTIESLGGSMSKQCQLITAEPGELEVKWALPNTWLGPISGSGVIFTKSGRLAVGDASYYWEDEEWSNSDSELHSLARNPAPFGYIIETGGDGSFDLTLEAKKLNDYSEDRHSRDQIKKILDLKKENLELGRTLTSLRQTLDICPILLRTLACSSDLDLHVVDMALRRIDEAIDDLQPYHNVYW